MGDAISSTEVGYELSSPVPLTTLSTNMSQGLLSIATPGDILHKMYSTESNQARSSKRLDSARGSEQSEIKSSKE